MLIKDFRVNQTFKMQEAANCISRLAKKGLSITKIQRELFT